MLRRRPAGIYPIPVRSYRIFRASKSLVNYMLILRARAACVEILSAKAVQRTSPQILYWPCNLYAINNSAWAETRANRVRTNNNQLLLSDGSDAYSTVYAILQYGVRIRINECTASDAVRIGCVRIGINSAGGL